MTTPNEIIIQENIPLSDAEIAKLKASVPSTKVILLVCGGCSLFTMLLICWFMGNSFFDLKFYEYLLLLMGWLLLFGFAYACFVLVSKYDEHNLKKDIAAGKYRMTSILLSKDKTEYGYYFSFALPLQNKKKEIRLGVEEAVYRSYNKNSILTVEYLLFSKKVLLVK